MLAIVVEALLRVARRALKQPGGLDHRRRGVRRDLRFRRPVSGDRAGGGPDRLLPGGRASEPGRRRAAPGAGRALASTLKTVALWLGIWILPLLAVALAFGRGHVLTELAWFFSKLAVVTFGGAYAVLAYMAQAVVEGYGWLTPGEMLDALGLAETTPGPLILVNEFVGTLAAWRHGGGSPVMMGILGAVVTLWATFAPCFLWIFAGAPYIERLNAEPRLKSALAAVTAAVVGVILNLTVWFALHVLFARSRRSEAGPLRPARPELASIKPRDGGALSGRVHAAVRAPPRHRDDARGVRRAGARLAFAWEPPRASACGGNRGTE